jgi:hypothetical protein
VDCPSCRSSAGLRSVYQVARVPAVSNALLATRDEALAFPTGSLDLGVCERCGMISNVDFDAGLAAGGDGYEESQAFSPRFRAFSAELASSLVERHGLEGGRALEIGCGKGDFLNLLRERGVAAVVGVDPAVAPERLPSLDGIELVSEPFTEDHAHLLGELVVCRHTLEHIPDCHGFLTTLRRAIGGRSDVSVFFEVPDAGRILREGAFWDVYYEHCSYFTAGALARAFRFAGFEPVRLWLGFDEQYLLIEARPDAGRHAWALELEEDAGEVVGAAARFAREVERSRRRWEDRIAAFTAEGKRIVLWGSGSKGVGFLSTVRTSHVIEYVVDINPYKQGGHMAATGQLILPPERLREVRPDVVIVMNPTYRAEIAAQVDELGLASPVLTL